MITEVLRFFGIATRPREDVERHLAEMREATDRIQEGKILLEQSARELKQVAQEARAQLELTKRHKNAIDRLVKATRFKNGGG